MNDFNIGRSPGQNSDAIHDELETIQPLQTDGETISDIYASTLGSSKEKDAPSSPSVFSNDPGRPVLPKTQADENVTINYTPLSFDSLLKTLIDKAEANTANSATSNFGAAMAEFGDVNEIFPVSDPEIIDLAKKLGVSPAEALIILRNQGNTYLEQALKNASPEEFDHLLYAYFFPEARENLSPNLKALLTRIEQEVQNQIREEYGLSPSCDLSYPKNWKLPPNTPPVTDYEKFLQKLTDEFDFNFEVLLQEAVENGDIPQEMMQNLRTLHYSEIKIFQGSEQQTFFEQLEGKAKAQLEQKYGPFVNWQPTSDAEQYQQILNGAYRQAFKENVEKYQPPLTKEQKIQIYGYHENPEDPELCANIPKDIKLLVDELKKLSATEIQDRFGLPKTWGPTTSRLNPPNGNNSVTNFLQNAVKEIEEMTKKAEEMLNQMPQGPERISQRNYLKALADALVMLQELIFYMQGTDSTQSKQFNNARKEMALEQLAKQSEQNQQVAEKKGKMANAGGLNKFLNVLGNVTMIAFAVAICVGLAAMGPLGLVVGLIGLASALFYVIDSTTAQFTNKPSLMQQMFEGINNSTDNKFLKFLASYVVVCIVSVGNPLFLVNLLCQDSQCVQNLIGAFGGDEKSQQLGALVITMVLQVAAMVAFSICTGGAGSPLLVASLITRFTTISADTAIKGVKVAVIAYDVVMASLQIANSGIAINNSVLQAQIEQIKGNYEADVEEITAMINMLKKLVQKILDMLQGNADWSIDISKFESSIWSDMSQITKELYSRG
jgi:hypothetical protein